MKLLNNKQPPIYLHFFDRELRRAENANYSDQMILNYLICTTIASMSYSYSNASLLLENSLLFPKSISLIIELEKIKFIRLLTNEHSIEEFIESRRVLYSHVSARYPMYFTDTSNSIWPSSPSIITSSTTAYLRGQLQSWIDNSNNHISISKDNFKKSDLKSFRKRLIRENEKAVTLDLLLSSKQIKDSNLRRNSGRLISYFYTKRYLELFNGDLLCNLPNLNYYDTLSTNRKYYNSILLMSILQNCLIPQYFFKNNSFNQPLFLAFIQNDLFKEFQIELSSLVLGLINNCDETQSGDFYKAIKLFDYNFDKNYKSSNMNIEGFLATIYSKLYSLSQKLSHQFKNFYKEYLMSKSNLTTNKKVLIVSTTTIEAKIFLDIISAKINNINAYSIDKITLWNLGVLGNCEVHMLKVSEMGSSKPSGSALTIYDAIKIFNPDFVIMIGIAYGLKKDRQNIGDILVSRELQDYDSNKKTERGIIQRGNRIPASATLLDRFDNSSLLFNKFPVELGFIISGDTLVDNKEFVETLKLSFPEAIGGEMEGTGLQSSCHRDHKEWILIKGICDFGFDKQNAHKDEDQKKAVLSVCEYLIFTLENFDF